MFKPAGLVKISNFPKAAGAFFLGGTLLVMLGLNGQLAKNRPLPAYADEMIAKCAQETNHQSCYEKEIPRLTQKISMEDAFTVTSLVQEKDQSYKYCHVLGHNLSAREVDKDPSRWKEVISRCTMGSCSNGCTHGALQEHFRADKPKAEDLQASISDLSQICQDRSGWTPTENERAGCYHALGHTTIYLTGANLAQSVDLCQKISLNHNGQSYYQNCLEGAFMQIFQPLEPEDEALVKDIKRSKETLLTFCGQFRDYAEEACYREGWVLFSDEVKTPTGLAWFCSQIPGQRAIDACYSKMFFSLMNVFNFDSEKMKDLCLGLPSPWSADCFADAAARYITAERNFSASAIAMCVLAAASSLGEKCYQRLVLYSDIVYHQGSDDLDNFCRHLPEPWQTQCKAKEKHGQS
jgi:hypothetical protein